MCEHKSSDLNSTEFFLPNYRTRIIKELWGPLTATMPTGEMENSEILEIDDICKTCKNLTIPRHSPTLQGNDVLSTCNDKFDFFIERTLIILSIPGRFSY